MLSMLPKELLTKTGLRATAEVLAGKKSVALYFRQVCVGTAVVFTAPPMSLDN